MAEAAAQPDAHLRGFELLDADGRGSRFGDANRIRQWMEGPDPVLRVAKVRHPRRLLLAKRR